MTKISSLPHLTELNDDVLVPVVDLNETNPNDQNKKIVVSLLRGEGGDRGTKGNTGDIGQSAYQLWLNEDGNEGKSFDDFMEFLKGEDGIDGKSAYEIALDNGFEGTEQEWLDSLVDYQFNSSDFSKVGDAVWFDSDDDEIIEIDDKQYLLSGTEFKLEHPNNLNWGTIVPQQMILDSDLVGGKFKVISIPTDNDETRIIISVEDSNKLLVSNSINLQEDLQEELLFNEITLLFEVNSYNNYILINSDNITMLLSSTDSKQVNFYLSDDNGDTWSDENITISSLVDTSIFNSIAYGDQWLVVGSSINQDSTSTVLKFDVSTKTWSTFNIPLDKNNCKISTTNTGYVILADDRSGLVSIDNGQSWSNITLPNDSPESFNNIENLNNELLVAIPSQAGKILQSTDNGQSWQVISGYDVILDITTSVSSKEVVVLPINNSNEALMTSDSGVTWNSITLPITDSWKDGKVFTNENDNEVIVLRGMEDGVYSTDNGQIWHTLNIDTYNTLDELVEISFNDKDLNLVGLMGKGQTGFKLLGVNEILYSTHFHDVEYKKLTDKKNFTTYSRMSLIPSMPISLHEAIDGAANPEGFIYASYKNVVVMVYKDSGHTLYSFDYGKTFTEGEFLDDYNLAALRYFNTDSGGYFVVFGSNESGKIYISNNNGVNWYHIERPKHPDTGNYVHLGNDLAYRSEYTTRNNKMIIFPFGGQIVYVRGFNDESWTEIDISHLGNISTASIYHVDDNSDVESGNYVAFDISNESRVFYTSDYGQTWAEGSFTNIPYDIMLQYNTDYNSRHTLNPLFNQFTQYTNEDGEHILALIVSDSNINNKYYIIISRDKGRTWEQSFETPDLMNFSSPTGNALFSSDTGMIFCPNSASIPSVNGRYLDDYVYSISNDTLTWNSVAKELRFDLRALIWMSDYSDYFFQNMIARDGLFILPFIGATSESSFIFYSDDNGRTWYKEIIDSNNYNGYIRLIPQTYPRTPYIMTVIYDGVDDIPIIEYKIFKLDYINNQLYGFKDKVKRNGKTLYMRIK